MFSVQDDQIITPFAQILASLKEVTQSLSEPNIHINLQARDNVSKISKGFLAKQTVESLDWCLGQLEHMQVRNGLVLNDCNL